MERRPQFVAFRELCENQPRLLALSNRTLPGQIQGHAYAKDASFECVHVLPASVAKLLHSVSAGKRSKRYETRLRLHSHGRATESRTTGQHGAAQKRLPLLPAPPPRQPNQGKNMEKLDEGWPESVEEHGERCKYDDFLA